MKKTILSSITLVALLAALPALSQSQTGTNSGATTGGNAAPAGSGSGAGGISPADRAIFRERGMMGGSPAARYQGNLAVGTTLPDSITFRRIEDRPQLSAYRYARIGDRVVIVDQGNRVVEIID